MKGKIMLLTILFLVLGAAMIRADSPPQISLTLTRYEPYPAQPGNYVDVWIEVDNQGLGDAPNVTVQLLPEYPFSIDPGVNAISQVGDLSPLESALLHYRVRVDENALSGVNVLKLRYQTTSVGNTWNGQSLDVYVLGTNKIEVSDVSTTLLEPGKPTQVTFLLSNVGSSPIRNLVFSWKQPSDVILPVGSDNKKYMDSIGIGEKAAVTFTMTTNPDTAPGVYPVVLTMNYTNGNTTSTAVSEMGFIVGGTTDFDISAEGSGGQVSLSIANIGANNANSVTVEIPDQPSFSVTGGFSSILGNLIKGDYTTATFQISSRIARNATGSGFTGGQASRNATGNFTGNQNLLVRISYTDTTGQRQTVEKEVALPSGILSSSSSGTFTSTRTQSNGQGLIYIIIGVAGIAAIVGFFLYRQRRKKKK